MGHDGQIGYEGHEGIGFTGGRDCVKVVKDVKIASLGPVFTDSSLPSSSSHSLLVAITLPRLLSVSLCLVNRGPVCTLFFSLSSLSLSFILPSLSPKSMAMVPKPGEGQRSSLLLLL